MARDAVEVFKAKRNRIRSEIAETVDRATAGLRSRIINKHLSSSKTQGNKLKRKTGRLIRSIIVQPAKGQGKNIKSELVISSPYAGVHFGKKGEETIIRARAGKALAIPTYFSQDSNGVRIGSPRSAAFKNTYISNGNIMGQVHGVGDKVPLFKLAREVSVPVRIDIEKDLLIPTSESLEKLLAPVAREF